MPKKAPEPGFYYRRKRGDDSQPVHKDAYEVLGTIQVPASDQIYAILRPLMPMGDTAPSPHHFSGVGIGAFEDLSGTITPALKRITDQKIVKQLEKVRNEMCKAASA